jgi:hypothetical protein
MKNLLYILLILLSSCSTYYVNSQSPSTYTLTQEIVVQDYPTINYVPIYSFTPFYSNNYYLPFYRYYFLNYNYYANSWNFNWSPYQFYGCNNYYNWNSWYNPYPTYGYNNWNYYNHHNHIYNNPFYQSANNHWKPLQQNNYTSVKQTDYKTYSDNKPVRQYTQPERSVNQRQNFETSKSNYRPSTQQVPNKYPPSNRPSYNQTPRISSPSSQQPRQNVRQYQQPVRQQPRHSPQPSHKNNMNVRPNSNVKMGR